MHMPVITGIPRRIAVMIDWNLAGAFHRCARVSRVPLIPDGSLLTSARLRRRETGHGTEQKVHIDFGLSFAGGLKIGNEGGF
jgi:hypothetical protein